MSDAFRKSIPSELFFKGRPGDPRLGEWVKSVESATSFSPQGEGIVLFGCPDDLGVTLNRGRAGAKEGPNSIRKHLYKMTPPMEFEWEKKITLGDLGNFETTPDILENHSRAKQFSKAISERGHSVIALGGGHDFAAPNFLGFCDGVKASSKSKPKFGLLNVDPHLDVRELENGKPNSGTPFRQILDSGELAPGCFVEFGARTNRNSRSHLQYCKQKKVQVLTWEEIHKKTQPPAVQFEKALTLLARRCSVLGVTFDMDTCSDAEGVSAAPVLGFSAQELCKMAEAVGRQKKVRFFEIAEVAPQLDTAERSSRIAAEVIYFFLRARALVLQRR